MVHPMDSTGTVAWMFALVISTTSLPMGGGTSGPRDMPRCRRGLGWDSSRREMPG